MKFFKWIKKLLFGIESKPSTKSNKDVSKEQTNKVYSETPEIEFKEEPKLEVFYGKPMKFEPIVEVEAVEPVVEQKKVEKAPKKAKKAKKAKKIEIPVIESDKVKKLVENNPKKKTKKPSDKK